MAGTYVGIDIGSKSTKLVILEANPKMTYVDSCIFPTPLELGENAQQQIDSRIFLQEVTKVIPVSKLRQSRVALNLPPASISILSIFLPIMGTKELKAAAVNEAKRKMIPASGPNHVFECFLLGERMVNVVTRFEVLVVRTDKVYIQRLIDVFKNVDIIPSLIIPSSFTFSLLPVFSQENSQKDIDMAVVDLGLTSFSISIFREGELNFFRNTMYGVQDVIQDFAQRLGLSEQRIEEEIKAKGVPEVNFNLKDKVAVAEEIMRQKYESSIKTQESGVPEEINLLELRMLWQGHIDKILHELRRSLSYYKEQSGGRRIEYINFIGGGCHIGNLFEILTSQIGGMCKTVLPFEGIEVPPDKQKITDKVSSPVLSSAVALALSLGVKSKRHDTINFVPLDLRQRELAEKRRIFIVTTLVLLIAVFGFLTLQTIISSVSLSNNIKKTGFDLERFKRTSGRLKDLTQREKLFEQRLSLSESLSQKRLLVLAPLNDLKKIIPDKVYLTSFKLGLGKVEIKAIVYADYENALTIVDQFKKNLVALPYFSNIEITPLKFEKVSPQFGGGTSEVQIDQESDRDFVVTADFTVK
ncbi:MAG: pilus assembly protein PilM [Candidatus Omnitrophica bacterium]|nr:pilus assembly protein PilM [Candidatus Omnitrophota bacterium]